MSQADKPEPMPKPGEKVVVDLVIADLRARAEFGKSKYGTYLMTHNGRDTQMDLYQELLDAVKYMRMDIEERNDRLAASAVLAVSQLRGIAELNEQLEGLSDTARLRVIVEYAETRNE